MFTSIGNALRRLVRPRLDPKTHRIQWKCRCGHELYADISLRYSEEIARLTLALQGTSTTIIPVNEIYPIGQLPSHAGLQVSPVNAHSIPSSNRIPSDTNCSTFGSPDSSITEHPQTNLNETFLEVCINVGEYKKTLREINLKGIHSDEALFARIRAEYLKIRKRRSWLRLFKPCGVHFVEFEFFDPESVWIRQQPSTPPSTEVDAGHYIFHPCIPLGVAPQVPIDAFLHGMSCDAPFANDPLGLHRVWLPRLPQKASPPIIVRDNILKKGWGIHIIEGPDWVSFFIVNLIIAIMSGVAAFLWTLYKHDFSGAFTFAAWILMVVNACMLGYIAKWNRL
ncbi:hypothetical protein BGZ57DRAFT_837578 [Hyaloscypha finlandica]|nr:hypothetical protein BGZ57DRAFT_837578 [Hyaloscypha finlandica]